MIVSYVITGTLTVGPGNEKATLPVINIPVYVAFSVDTITMGVQHLSTYSSSHNFLTHYYILVIVAVIILRKCTF